MDSLTALTAPVSLTPNIDADSILKSREDDAYQQLEAVFISMLIKEMRTAGLEDGLFPGDSSDTFGGLFDSFLGEELANSGGIGLQRLLKDPVVAPVADASETHRLAKEAYGHATSDTNVTPVTGS